MNETAVKLALKRIAHEIIEKNRSCENLCLVGIKRRGVPIAEAIADNIFEITGERPLSGAVDVTFYRDDLTKIYENPCVGGTALNFDINGKIVVLVDFIGKNVPTSKLEHIEVKMPPYDDRIAVELYG